MSTDTIRTRTALSLGHRRSVGTGIAAASVLTEAVKVRWRIQHLTAPVPDEEAQATVLLVIEAATQRCVDALRVAALERLLPCLFASGDDLEPVAAAVGALVDGHEDDDPHLSLVLVRGSSCRIVHAGGNRHVLLRGKRARVLNTTAHGYAESLATTMVPGDWVVVLGHRTGEALPLATTALIAQRHGTPGRLCTALIERAEDEDPGSSHAAIALRVQPQAA